MGNDRTPRPHYKTIFSDQWSDGGLKKSWSDATKCHCLFIFAFNMEIITVAKHWLECAKWHLLPHHTDWSCWNISSFEMFRFGLVFELPHQKCFSHLSNKLFIDLETKDFHAQSNLFTHKCYCWYPSLQPHLFSLRPTFQNLAIHLLILKLRVLYCHFFHSSTRNETMWCNTRFIGLCWDWNKGLNPFITYDALDFTSPHMR